MMGAKELRIGYAVLCNGLRTFINKSLMKDIINEEIMWAIDPIPLTEEMLVKCGFKNWGDKYTYSKGSFIIHKRKRVFIIKKSIPPIDSVHLLQNAYYVFTRKELEIKL